MKLKSFTKDDLISFANHCVKEKIKEITEDTYWEWHLGESKKEIDEKKSYSSVLIGKIKEYYSEDTVKLAENGSYKELQNTLRANKNFTEDVYNIWYKEAKYLINQGLLK